MLLDQILFRVPCPIFWKNLDGEFLGCNKLFLEVAEFYEYSQLVGKKDSELPWKEHKDEYYKDDQYVITTGETITRTESIPLHGRIIISETTKAPLLQDGKIIGILGICLDVTDRKEKEFLEIDNLKRLAISEAEENFRRSVGQMIHDVRTPLATLQMTVQSMPEIAEEKRIVLRNAAIAITDITAQLLKQYEPERAKDEALGEREVVLVSTLLTNVIGESRRRYKDKSIKFEYELSQLNAFVFVKIDQLDLRRSITNLINNAVEASEDGGVIRVKLSANNEWVTISILDDGKGMPKEVLEKIKNKETVTHGKEKGHGIGMSVVRDMVENNYGRFDIFSSTEAKGHGTTISLRFPRVDAPDWIVEEVTFNKDSIILILDDDKSIHGGWDLRLVHILKKIPTIVVKHFSRGDEVIKFVAGLSVEERQNTCFLSDYELIGQELHGLEIIKKVAIKNSMLVTSYYSDTAIKKAALHSGMRILPKDLVHLVPINVVQAKSDSEFLAVHMVFVDDEKAFTQTLVANYYSQLITQAYSNPFEFLDDVDKYALDTRIILDNYYYMEDGGTYNIDGLTLAKKLHEKGFNNLCLLSGEEFPVPEYLDLVIKTDKLALAKLYK